MTKPVSALKNLDFNCIYADDYQKALEFYQKYFGFEKKFDMGENSCWGIAGEVGMYIQGGCISSQYSENSVRTSVMYLIDDAHTLHAALKKDGVSLIHDKPEDMGQGYWFQFYDPAGNILEVLSYKEPAK